MENNEKTPGKTGEEANVDAKNAAERILGILGLPDTFKGAASAAVEAERRLTKLSPDGLVQRITTAANLAERRGVSRDEFLEDFLAQNSARRILESVNLPITNNIVSRVTASVKAEAKDTGLSIEQTTIRIMEAASEDRGRGVRIDVFYFEDVKWRSNVGTSKAEQRKLNNLEVNARVKQRLRQKLGAS